MENKYYSIVDLANGEKFGVYSLEQAKSKGIYYAKTFKTKVAVIDNFNQVIIGYNQSGKEIKKIN